MAVVALAIIEVLVSVRPREDTVRICGVEHKIEKNNDCEPTCDTTPRQIWADLWRWTRAAYVSDLSNAITGATVND